MADKIKVTARTGGARPPVRRAAASRVMIGGAQDPAEMAADKTADRIMRMTRPAPILHRKRTACEAEDKTARRQPAEEKEMVMPKRAGSSLTLAPGAAAAPASPPAAKAIGALGSGQPLASAERAFFEPRFGADLSAVRVHDDPQGDRASQAINARAFTLGNHIAFAAGAFDPGSKAGRHLLAHELGHTIQQSGATRASAPLVQRFPGEAAALRARRLAAISYARAAATWIGDALRLGYLWPFERQESDGRIANVQGPPGTLNYVETAAARRSRLSRLIRMLRRLATRLESAPIPPGWLAPYARGTSGLISGSSTSQTETDVYMFLIHHQATGAARDWVFDNLFYIEHRPVRRRAVAPVRFPAAVGTGINISIPDPENAPMTYSRVTGHERGLLDEPIAQGVILEVFRDWYGFFYTYGSVRHDLPREP